MKWYRLSSEAADLIAEALDDNAFNGDVVLPVVIGDIMYLDAHIVDNYPQITNIISCCELVEITDGK